MAAEIELRMHYCKAQNVYEILENIKLNAGSTAWELQVDVHKFNETLTAYSIFYEF